MRGLRVCRKTYILSEWKVKFVNKQEGGGKDIDSHFGYLLAVNAASDGVAYVKRIHGWRHRCRYFGSSSARY